MCCFRIVPLQGEKKKELSHTHKTGSWYLLGVLLYFVCIWESPGVISPETFFALPEDDAL